MADNRLPSRIANRYTLIRLLGQGGFAQVHLAHDERLNRDVAIKFLSQSRAENAIDIERFKREAVSIASLSHPNIVQIYDMDQQGDWYYIVMEYIRGHSLEAYTDTHGGKLTIEESLNIVIETLNALGYAHTHNLIHRDIKPQNILLAADGTVKLSDFGLVLRPDDQRITATGAFVGTLLYTSPEALRGNRVDHRADLYAIGAMFYELITGRPPYEGSPTSIIEDIITRPVKPPRMIDPAIPETVEKVIMRLMSKSADDRYASAADVIEALPDSEALEDEQRQSLKSSAEIRMQKSRLSRLMASSSGELTFPDHEDIIKHVTAEMLVYVAQEDNATALETERRRIASMIQEDIIAQVNLIISQINMYEMNATSPQQRMSLNVIGSLVRQLLQRALDLEVNLQPAVLESLGLEPALETLVNQQRRVHGLNITLDVPRLRERLPAQTELMLFRGAQDFINRAVKQAGATQVFVRIHRADNLLTCVLEDNGSMTIHEPVHQIEQRVRGLGGHIAVDASDYGGLKLIITFDVSPPIDFTERESEVIALVAEGLTNKEIAAILDVRPRTIKFHLDNIFNKLGINTRTEAAIYAIKHGLTRKS